VSSSPLASCGPSTQSSYPLAWKGTLLLGESCNPPGACEGAGKRIGAHVRQHRSPPLEAPDRGGLASQWRPQCASHRTGRRRGRRRPRARPVFHRPRSGRIPPCPTTVPRSRRRLQEARAAGEQRGIVLCSDCALRDDPFHLGLAQDATLVGHNVWFDWRFILTAPRAHGMTENGNSCCQRGEPLTPTRAFRDRGMEGSVSKTLRRE